MERRRVRVWDLPVRVAHWSLAALVAAAFVTQAIGGNAMVWHGRIGLAVLGLLVFRIVWGFVGSSHARFRNFVRGPGAIRDYLAGRWQGPGHNPLGALAVVALLATLLALALTGLFANDDIAFQGPLHRLVGADVSERITGIHKLFESALILVVALHVAAIVFHLRVKRDNLIKPMLTGWKDLAAGEPAVGGGPAAFIVAAAVAVLAVWAASGALLPPPPPAAAAPVW